MRHILNVNKSFNENMLLDSLNFMKANQLIIFRSLLFLYKKPKVQAPKYLTDRIRYRSEANNRELRNSNDIQATDAIKTCSQNSLFYKGIRVFNSIPIETREAR